MSVLPEISAEGVHVLELYEDAQFQECCSFPFPSRAAPIATGFWFGAESPNHLESKRDVGFHGSKDPKLDLWVTAFGFGYCLDSVSESLAYRAEKLVQASPT